MFLIIFVKLFEVEGQQKGGSQYNPDKIESNTQMLITMNKTVLAIA